MKIIIHKIYSKPPKENYETIKTIFTHIDEIWSIDLAGMVDYNISNNKEYRYKFVIIVIYSNYVWTRPLKNKNAQTHKIFQIF